MQDSKDLKEETGAAPHECLHHSLVRVKSDIDSADADVLLYRCASCHKVFTITET